MKTYFLQFKVVPTADNEHFLLADGALAACWIRENDPQTAYAKAAFQVSKYDWQIIELETSPVEVTKEHFLEKNIGLEQYNKAQNDGMAICYMAWARDKKTTAGPITMNSSYRPDISGLLEKQKKLNLRGRCLHYASDHRCREIINAHSIQKNQLLSMISKDGYVYMLSSNMRTLNKNNGLPKYEKKGINNVSTFLGFCKRHDNELFEPIDNFPLIPTDHQVLLYAYRSLCKELFVKENALNLLEHRVSNTNHKFVKKYFETLRIGTEFGLNNLKKHKLLYDNPLKSKSFCDIRYVLFIAKEKPPIVFSGLFYPDFDFMGRQLQNLANYKDRLELITFCSAPMDCGWGYLFAWHHTSSKVCLEFMRSLATKMYDGQKTSDLLFRMVIYNCENYAICPEWWEKLSANNHEQITERVASMASSFSITGPTYLCEGLDGISDWHFDSVVSKMD